MSFKFCNALFFKENNMELVFNKGGSVLRITTFFLLLFQKKFNAPITFDRMAFSPSIAPTSILRDGTLLSIAFGGPEINHSRRTLPSQRFQTHALWPKFPMNDCHFGYITKLDPKRKPR